MRRPAGHCRTATTQPSPRAATALAAGYTPTCCFALPCPAGHEIVEDVRNGVRFQFKRKRSAVPATAARAAAASAHKSHLLKTPAAQLAQQATTAAAAVESPYADELRLPLLGEQLEKCLQMLPERAAPADRLLACCSSICTASVKVSASLRRRRGGSCGRPFQHALPRAGARRSRGGAAADDGGACRAPLLGACPLIS